METRRLVATFIRMGCLNILAWPFITADLPGIGGEIKTEPGHFTVEEIPVYEPCGKGAHVFVRLEREGWNTRDLAERLAGLFQIKETDVGCAGLKDKQARVVQTFSLNLSGPNEMDIAGQIEEHLPVKVLQARRHTNKLKTGHLLGNIFSIVLADPHENARAGAAEIAGALKTRGLANFYGHQRFGAGGDNVSRGREALLGRGPRKNWLRRFLLSSYQAYLFNTWLSRRIERGWFDGLFAGDVAKKTDTGGIFEVEDEETERPRFEAGAITYTGPIYGYKMRWAKGRPGDLEREILDEFEVTAEMLRGARLEGSRRPARIFIPNLTVEPHARGLLFTFSLPKGAYATTVLREFTKTDPELPE